MSQKEILENRLKQLEEILDLQVEMGEDTAIVMEKIREVEALLRQNS